MKLDLAAKLVAADLVCNNGWIWEQCALSWWREPCDFELDYPEECGWYYWALFGSSEYWVSCETFGTWVWCG